MPIRTKLCTALPTKSRYCIPYPFPPPPPPLPPSPPPPSVSPSPLSLFSYLLFFFLFLLFFFSLFTFPSFLLTFPPSSLPLPLPPSPSPLPPHSCHALSLRVINCTNDKYTRLSPLSSTSLRPPHAPTYLKFFLMWTAGLDNDVRPRREVTKRPG